jgi:hypothetical protein
MPAFHLWTNDPTDKKLISAPTEQAAKEYFLKNHTAGNPVAPADVNIEPADPLH